LYMYKNQINSLNVNYYRKKGRKIGRGRV
jgi:hypothetical protein